jgi:arylsulfatase A-like enzyme/Tfp pilus assembly protein PilF
MRKKQPRRRTVVAALAAVVALGGAVAWWALRTPDFTLLTTADRNVLLVTIDTLRADALGCYGGRASTPHLDRLAARGARFDFAHSHAVVTLPSHASVLTGRYPYEHGIRDNTGYRLSPTESTLATLLKPQGFATAAFVGGFPLDKRFGLNAGFDTYDDALAGSAADDMDRERRADKVVASAIGWIDRQRGKWLAWVHVYDPHAPYHPPDEWAARFKEDPYLGEVSWTDFALGPLFDRLRREARRTLIVVTADHGESLGDHGELTHSLFAYEAVLRVPLIVAEIDPGRGDAARGVVVTNSARHVDLLPTVLDAVDVRLPESPVAPAGASLKESIEGRGGDRSSYFEAMTAAVTRGWAPLRGVIVGREKYIDLPIVELYDLSADPGERTNLASERAQRTEVLHNTLKLFNTAPPARAAQETPETLERLRSLGYIGGGVAAVKAHYTENDDPKKLIELELNMQRAADAYRAGRTGEAIERYSSVIAIRPDTEDAYRKLALVYWRAGRPADAIETLERALRNGVTQSEVRNKLAQYLAEAGKPEKAIALLEGETGDDPDALIALGNAYTVSGRSRDAMRMFERLLTIDPNHALAHENLGVARLQVRDYPGAEESLRRAIALDPNLAGAQTALGVALVSTGRRTEAIEAWKHAVEIDGTELNALFNLTVNLAQMGHREEARVYGQRFLAAAPPGLQAEVATVRRILGG